MFPDRGRWAHAHQEGRDRGIEDRQWTLPRARQGPGIRNPCRPRPHVISSHSRAVAKRRPDWPQGRVTRLWLKRRAQKGLRGEGQGGGDPDGEGGERAKQYLAHTLTRCATDRSGCAWFAATIWTSEISALAATNAPLLDHPSTVWYNDSKGTAMAHEGRRGTSPPPSPSSAEPWGRKCRKSCPRYLSCYLLLPLPLPLPQPTERKVSGPGVRCSSIRCTQNGRPCWSALVGNRSVAMGASDNDSVKAGHVLIAMWRLGTCTIRTARAKARGSLRHIRGPRELNDQACPFAVCSMGQGSSPVGARKHSRDSSEALCWTRCIFEAQHGRQTRLSARIERGSGRRRKRRRQYSTTAAVTPPSQSVLAHPTPREMVGEAARRRA